MVEPNPRTKKANVAHAGVSSDEQTAIEKARARLKELAKTTEKVKQDTKKEKIKSNSNLKDIENSNANEGVDNTITQPENSLDNFVEGNISTGVKPEDLTLQSNEVQSNVAQPAENLESSLSNVSTDLGSTDRGNNPAYQPASVYSQKKEEKFYDDNFAEGRGASERAEVFNASTFREFQRVPRVETNARSVDARDLAFDSRIHGNSEGEERLYEPRTSGTFRQDEIMGRTDKDIQDMRFRKYNSKDLNNSGM